jgi:hypothetical protein
MRCRSLLFVTVLVVLLAGTAYGELQVFFSPQGGCDHPLIRFARSAQMYLGAGCSSLRNSQVPMSRKEAQARGYTPCKVCQP